MIRMRTGVGAITLGILGAYLAFAQNNMTFFITSAGPGKGADLGGLAGADRHCQSLAAAAGAGNRTWHAYLSTTGSGRHGSRQCSGSDRQRSVVQRKGRSCC